MVRVLVPKELEGVVTAEQHKQIEARLRYWCGWPEVRNPIYKLELRAGRTFESFEESSHGDPVLALDMLYQAGSL